MKTISSIGDASFHSLTREGVRWCFFTGKQSELLVLVNRLKKGTVGSTINVCNVHMFIESARDKALGKAISANTFAICDGQPIAWLLRLVTGRKVPRVTGPDFFEEILLNHMEGRKVALVGGTSTLLTRIRDRLGAARQSNLLTIDPGIVTKDGTVTSAITATLRAFQPDIVFVGLGCPKQEKWMHNAARQVPAVFIGVGAAFENFVGDLRRAPLFMGRLGLEWLYRLIQQPRLLRRYAVTNISFLLVLASTIIHVKLRRLPFA